MPRDPIETRAKVFVSAPELAALLALPQRPALLDVRLPKEDSDGRADYRDGHIPGAVFVDLPTELADLPAGPAGRRPLPRPEILQRDARRWGLRRGQPVVVYDDSEGLRAGRAWWVLRWAGIEDVRLLDGGLAAWRRAGGVLSRDIPLPDQGDVEIGAGHLPTVTAEEAAALAETGALFDARGKAAYVAGHIPGAISAPTAGNLDAEGLVATAEALRARFATLGLDGAGKVAVSCGGGVSAAHEIAVLASLGIEAALFPASWSGWSADPSRPAAIGEAPR